MGKVKDKRTQARELARRRLRARLARWEMYPGKRTTEHREFPALNSWGSRKAVCKRCHCVMPDYEPSCYGGEFYHPNLDKKGKPHWCRNAGRTFTIRDLEVVPFLRKARRRYLKRMNIRP